MYNIYEKAPPAPKLSSDHIAEFAFTTKRWTNKQEFMYRFKNECTRQGLRNGTDYVFLNPAGTNGQYETMQIYFEDASYVSYMMLWYECNKD